jgi:hypothetical protein
MSEPNPDWTDEEVEEWWNHEHKAAWEKGLEELREVAKRLNETRAAYRKKMEQQADEGGPEL